MSNGPEGAEACRRVGDRRRPRGAGAMRAGYWERRKAERRTGSVAADIAREARGAWSARRLLRQAVPMVLGLALVWMLSDRLRGVDLDAVWMAANEAEPWRWALAAGLTFLSFWALGQYDSAIHGAMGLRTRPEAARRAGMAAIAIAQTTGLGLLVGSVVRWRCMPDLTLARCAAITGAVGLSFVAALLPLSAVAALLAEGAGAVPPYPAALAVAILVATAGLVMALPLVPPSMLPRWTPSLRLVARIGVLTAFDTLAAGMALAVFCPPEVPVTAVLAAYLLALGAGLLAATPGGVGAFEITLLALLPQMGAEPLLAAVLCFRVVYFAVPAVLAAVAVLLAPGIFHRPLREAKLADGRAVPERLLELAPRAEAGLMRAAGALALTGPGDRPLGVIRRTPQALVLIGDPLVRFATAAAELRHAARRESRLPAAYKIGPRNAVAARALGWRVVRLWPEAWVAPTRFDLSLRSRRQLRRKLRKAQGAGVVVSRAAAPLPMAEMARVDRDWCARMGGARGLSMGRFAPEYVSHQQVWLARDADTGRLLAFLTLHCCRAERTLDLMRSLNVAPDGTMHMLMAAAIAQAGRDRVPALSLAAVPGPPPWMPARLWPLLQRHAAPGLHQFKQAFDPHWRPLYMAAPNRAGIGLAGSDVLRQIARPGRERPAPAGDRVARDAAGGTAFAPGAEAWHEPADATRVPAAGGAPVPKGSI